MTDELAERRAAKTGEEVSDPMQCPGCGGFWFTTAGVALMVDNKITGYALPLQCRECGLKFQAL